MNTTGTCRRHLIATRLRPIRCPSTANGSACARREIPPQNLAIEDQASPIPVRAPRKRLHQLRKALRNVLPVARVDRHPPRLPGVSAMHLRPHPVVLIFQKRLHTCVALASDSSAPHRVLQHRSLDIRLSSSSVICSACFFPSSASLSAAAFTGFAVNRSTASSGVSTGLASMNPSG